MDGAIQGGGMEMLLILVIYLIPLVLTIFSKKIPIYQKPFWALIAFTFTWFGYLFIYGFVINKAHTKP